jgi:hypothetical protein
MVLYPKKEAKQNILMNSRLGVLGVFGSLGTFLREPEERDRTCGTDARGGKFVAEKGCAKGLDVLLFSVFHSALLQGKLDQRPTFH